MSTEKPRDLHQKFVAQKPLKAGIHREKQEIVQEVEKLLVGSPFEGYTFVRMGAEHLVFVLEDPQQRDFVMKINFGVAMSVLSEVVSRESAPSIEVIQERCRQASEEERLYQERLWKGLAREFPGAIIPTRRSKLSEIPCSEGVYRALFTYMKGRVNLPLQESVVVPSRLPVIVTQQRQINVAKKEEFWMGAERRSFRGKQAVDELSQEFHGPKDVFSELTIKNAFDDAFPSLVRLVNFAKQDSTRFQAFQKIVVQIDRYGQKTRILLDMLGGDNLYFAQKDKADLWQFLCVDPFFPRYAVGLQRPDLTLLETAIQERNLPAEQKTLTELEVNIARTLYFQATAVKALAWACKVPSSLEIKGLDENFSFLA